MDDRADLVRERRRRLEGLANDAVTLPVVSRSAAPDDAAPAGEPEPERGRVRLTKSQQLTLVRLLARLDDLRELRAVLAEDYPEINALSDRALRWWRQRVENGEFAELVAAERALVERSGLALRSVRVEALRRQYRKLGQLEERATDPNLILRISQERLRVLAELRAEAAGWQPAGPVASGTLGDDVPDSLDELYESLQLFRQQQNDVAEALIGAQRPSVEELE
jgi:hypothetical protein